VQYQPADQEMGAAQTDEGDHWLTPAALEILGRRVGTRLPRP
jgi:hypothetical protein